MMLNTADTHDFIDQLTLEGVPWQEYFSHCDPQRMECFFTTL